MWSTGLKPCFQLAFNCNLRPYTKDRKREQVYLLGRLGGSRRALEIIVDDLKDIAQAIAFVQVGQCRLNSLCLNPGLHS